MRYWAWSQEHVKDISSVLFGGRGVVSGWVGGVYDHKNVRTKPIVNQIHKLIITLSSLYWKKNPSLAHGICFFSLFPHTKVT